MFNSISILTIAIIIAIVFYYSYQQKQQKVKLMILKKEKQEKVEIEKKYQEEQKLLEIEKNYLRELKEKKNNIIYKLQTDKVKYSFYNSDRDLKYSLDYLYKLIVQNNLWINEPFHSKLYELLILLNENEFMIFDRNSQPIKMNIRDHNNQISVSHAYEVFDTIDIIEFTIRDTINDILKYKKYDAQNIILAIFILLLKKSQHYLSKNIFVEIVENLLKDYKYSNEIKNIINLINKENSELSFIKNSVKKAYQRTDTHPYTDYEVSRQLLLDVKLPQKFLQAI